MNNLFLESKLTKADGDIINHWYIVCLSYELKKNPIARTVYDLPIVIFRDQNKIPVAMLDRCPHRGAQLSLGKCHKGELKCPYHGWTFAEKGNLVDIPSDGKRSTPKPNKHTFETYEQDGAIWIWIGDFNLKTATPPWRFPFHQQKGWAQYFMITDFNNEVTHLTQNFMDVPHTVFVHAKWFRNRKLMKVPVTVDVKNGSVKVNYIQPNDSIGFMDRILNPHKKPMIHTDEFIFPNITRVDYHFGNHQFIINSQCTPVSSGKTKVYTWICYRIGFLTQILKPFMQYYTREVITQDVNIMANHGLNLQRFPQFFHSTNYQSSQADELHLAIDHMREKGVANRLEPLDMTYFREREFWI